jgi:hypothetical protein
MRWRVAHEGESDISRLDNDVQLNSSLLRVRLALWVLLEVLVILEQARLDLAR